MSRFRYEGTNWAGIGWSVANPIMVLGDQITALNPTQYPVDGTVAGKVHDQNDYRSDNKYTSDHSAFKSPVIRAIDFGGLDDDRFAICENIRRSRDPRVKYVINEDKIFRGYAHNGVPAYTWDDYDGPRHDTHSHVSTISPYDKNMDEWLIGDEPEMQHKHNPRPDQLPRMWANGIWEKWVIASGTRDNTRTWDFYREDMAWVYERVIAPLEQKIKFLETDVASLKRRIAALEVQPSPPHVHDVSPPKPIGD